MSSFSWSVDPVACALGVIAVVLAWKAYRASTRHILKLVAVESSYCSSVRPENNGPHFEVVLVNLGLPLSRPSVHLYFERQEGVRLPSYTVELSPSTLEKDAVFEQGMRAVFNYVANNERDPSHPIVRSLSDITNPRKQKAAIIIRNAGGDVQRIPLYASTDFFTRMWNAFAHRFNFKFMVTMKGDRGEPVVRDHRVLHLPVFRKPSSTALRQFSEYCRNEVSRRIEESRPVT